MLSNGGHMNAHTRFVPMLAALLAVLTLGACVARLASSERAKCGVDVVARRRDEDAK
jgi:hypothetical protein